MIDLDNISISINGTNVIDENNSSVTPLGAGASFIGIATDISEYNQINLKLFGRPNIPVSGDITNAQGTLFFEFSDDGVNWDISVPSLVRTLGIVIPVPLINVGKYFRVIYLNDGGVLAIAILGLNDIAGVPTAQTVFRLTTYLLPLATKELVRTMDQGIQGSDPAALVRAGIMGKNPENIYVNLPATGHDNSNRTNTPLNAGATWTGEWHETIGFSNIVVAINSDQFGLLTVEFGDTALNIHPTVLRTFANPNAGQIYIFVPGSHYYRLKFTNTTAVNQTFLRVHSNLQVNPVGSIFSPADTPLSKNSLSQVVVSIPNDGVKLTYRACFTGLIPITNIGDIITITGSATKTIRVIRVELSGTRTASGSSNIVLLKRSTANTGGISSVLTNVPSDPNNVAATAVVRGYTTPTLTPGTLIGNVCSRPLNLPSITEDTPGGYIDEEFGKLGQSQILRGVNSVFAINMPSLVAGGMFYGMIEWTEELI